MSSHDRPPLQALRAGSRPGGRWPALSTALVAGLALAWPAAAAPAPKAPPSALFQELYQRVELDRLFPDSKTFADAEPLEPPAQILAEYRAAPPRTRADLAAFVAARFRIPGAAPAVTPKPELEPAAAAPASLETHIASLWPHLTRAPVAPGPWSSALPLAHKFVVPGGRFQEIYYWDSYFTMLGLVRDGRRDTAAAMTDDFADLIEAYGHVPNGSRSYYLSRSQPPVFYLMVAAVSDDPDAGWARRLPALKREYDWWMRGARGLKPGQASGHVVALPDGSILNRYWDFRAAPRDESYREDVLLAEAAGRPAPELYRDIRAAAESGWDFSARWFADGRSMRTIETTSLVPVDLNSLMFGLEQAIARGCAHAGDAACAAEFQTRAAQRKAAMNRYLWDPDSATFRDWNWRRSVRTDRPSAAMLFPLFTGEADSAQAQGVAAYVRAKLLAPGGLLAAPVDAGQQWDAPNGWAPLQWAAVQGLNAYGQSDLARDIAERWLATVSRVYARTGKLIEKYDMQSEAAGGGGEYPAQDGFGWTNGVTRALMQLYPEAAKQASLQTAPPPG